MTQEPTPKRRIDGGSILLAAAICLLFFWMLSQGACWSLGSGSWSLHNGILGTLGFMSLLQVALAIYVGFDAHRRGMHGFLWGALVLFTSIVGLVVYLIVCSGMFNQPTTVHQRCYVDERYKLTVYYHHDYGELFDLQEDPGEYRNLWDDPDAATLKSRLLLKYVHAELGKEPIWMPRVCGA